MRREAITHIPDSEYAHLYRDTLLIRLRAKRGDLKAVTLFYGDRFAPGARIPVRAIGMRVVCSDSLFDTFECRFASPFKRVCYYFYVEGMDGDAAYFDEWGFSSEHPWDRQKYFHFFYLHETDTPRIPSWFTKSVMYQIFPDSFANGRERMEPAPRTARTSEGIETQARYGGTLRGITESLGYLAGLGIGVG